MVIELRKLMLVCGAIFPLLLNVAQAGEMTSRQKEFSKICGSTRLFRQIVVNGDTKGLKVWFKPDALEKWNHLTRAMKSRNALPGINDLFEGSVVFYGSYQEHRSVAAFFNPWIDAGIIFLLDNSGEASLVEDFVLISGEHWRGEKVTNPLAVLMPGKLPFSVTIWRGFAIAKNIFSKKYPEEQEVEGLAIPSVNLDNELEIICARIALRFKLIAEFLGEKYQYVRKQAVVVKTLITYDKPEKLELDKYFAQSQNKVLLNTFFKIPSQVREKMKLYCFVPGKDNAILIFINPYLPRYAASVQVNKKGKPTIEWYDLFKSYSLYNSWIK